MSFTFEEKGGIGYITFDMPDSKVNLLTSHTLQQLDGILDDVVKNEKIGILIFKSAKKNVFIAGADIKEIENITEESDGKAKARAGQDVLNKIEDLPFPTLSVIDGVALGGGCEFALACTFRAATFNPKVKIGLPEVNLGFVPGFGGTYRLPRTIGLRDSLLMILSGKPVNAQKAFRNKLVDRVFTEKNLEAQVEKFAKDIINGNVRKKNKYKRKVKGVAGWFLEKSSLGNMLVYAQAKKNVMKQSKGHYPAPLRAIKVIKQTFHSKNRSRCLDIESSAFGKLAITQISKNLVQVFYLMEKYKKLSIDDTNDVEIKAIHRAGVLGAGVMGGGIAQLFSAKGIWTRMKDINNEALALGLRSARKVYESAVKRRRMKKAVAEEKIAHITTGLDYTAFGKMDLVVEAVVENIDLKKSVFKELSEQTHNETILATNTSALSVEEMAAVVENPSRVIGFHFFNPVHRMPLIEIITTPETSQATIATMLSFSQSLGKIPILVKDSCGFIVNRILLGYINEAGRILQECGDLEGIDLALTRFGMPMGPFTLSDEVGLDVGVKVLHILEGTFGDRFKPMKVFDDVYALGDLGKKTGKGFYIHNKHHDENPAIDRILGDSQLFLDEGECCDRLIYVMINEAARCLEDGIVDEPSAIDVGMIFGTGFPAFRGGLLRYADNVGLKKIVSRMEEFAKNDNTDRFKPCDYLLNLVNQSKGFYD